MSDAQDIVMKLMVMLATRNSLAELCQRTEAPSQDAIDLANVESNLKDHLSLYADLLISSLSKCERMEKVVEAARAIGMPGCCDSDCQCAPPAVVFIMSAPLVRLGKAIEALDAIHSDGNAGGGVIRTEDKPNA